MIENLVIGACCLCLMFVFIGLSIVIVGLGEHYGVWKWFKATWLGELTRPFWDFGDEEI